MRGRVLGLGDDDSSIVHSTRKLKQQTPSKSAPNAIVFYSTRSSGNFALNAWSSTGFVKVIWWTGEEEIAVANAPTSTISKAATASPNIKQITVFPCTSTGIPFGSFIDLKALNTSNAIINVDTTQLKNCSALTIAALTNSSLTLPEKAELSTLQIRNLIGNNILDFSSFRNLNLSIDLNSSVTGLKTYLSSQNTSLVLRTAYLNTPSPIDVPVIPLNFTGYLSILGVLFATTVFDFSYRSFSAIILSTTNATEIILNYVSIPAADLSLNSALSSVRCKDCVFTGYMSKKNSKVQGGLNVSNCNLSASALNVMFEDLGTVSPTTGFIQVQGNPGALTCNTSIATAKGYVVITQ